MHTFLWTFDRYFYICVINPEAYQQYLVLLFLKHKSLVHEQHPHFPVFIFLMVYMINKIKC